ncbi:polysialyltransferase family glycosyltransferase, partial [Brevibacterium samyangense]
MKRLFVVNGLFGFLTALSARAVGPQDEVDVLGLFCYSKEDNKVLEATMRSLLPGIRKVEFLTDTSEYTKKLADRRFMRSVSPDPAEIRMFFTHNTWLHNRVFRSFPEASIVLYEEGMASYYPGLLATYEARGRLQGVYLHNYCDRMLPIDAADHPEVFGLIDRERFRSLLEKLADRGTGGARGSRSTGASQLGPDAVLVVEQYLFRKGGAQTIDEAAAEYVTAIRTILGKGYRVVYKKHPRENTGLLERIRALLTADELSRFAEHRDPAMLLEVGFLESTPAAVVAISSTSLFTAPQYFDVPSFRIPSLAQFDVARVIPVERRGLVSNEVALAARVPTVDELPPALEVHRARDVFSSRMEAHPPLVDDEGHRMLADVDFGPEYVDLVKAVAADDTAVVSFDLFDTLVKRPASSGADIYALLDSAFRDDLPPYVRFSDVRRTVWGRLDADFASRGGRPAEYSLHDVYDYLARTLRLTEETANRMHAAEVALESRLVAPRRAGIALAHVARVYGKRWVVTTDTYFDTDELGSVALGKLPFGPDALFSSHEEQATKAAGDLFDVLVADLGVPAARVLHIGDREDHDVAGAQEHGLRAAWLPSATAAAGRHRAWSEAWAGIREERASALVRGLVTAHLFDNPYRVFDSESVVGGDPRLLGYAAVGPAISGWAQWILRTAHARGHDAVHFLSRDGYLPLDVARRLQEVLGAPFDGIDLRYTMSSRRAMFSVFNQEPGHVAYTEFVHGVNRRTTVDGLLRTRFGDEVATALGPSIAAAGPGTVGEPLGRHVEAVKNAISAAADDIIARTRGHNEAVTAYYTQALSGAEHPAIVDIGYSGSAQRGISLAAGRPVAGMYFTTMEHNTEHAWINDLQVDEFTSDPVFFTSGGLLEYLVTPAGLESCTGFEIRGGTSVSVLENSDPGDPVRGEVQAGVRAFLDDYATVFGPYARELVMRPRLAVHLLSTFLSHPTYEDVRTLDGARHEDLVA